MFKILFALAPYYLRSHHKNPAKAIAGFFTMMLFGGLSAVFLLAALFVWTMQSYDAVTACLVVGGAFFVFALLVYSMTHFPQPKRAKALALDKANTDPLAAKLPASIKHDPRVQEILAQIAKNPLAATTAAVTLGYALSGEFSGKK